MAFDMRFSTCFRALGRRISGFRRNTLGGVASITAIISPVLVGAMGLGGEAGYWYLTQRKVQNAADVAAHATVIRLNQGDDETALQALAEHIVAESDVNIALSTVALNNPPNYGAYLEDSGAVEVIVTRTVPRLFSAIYGEGDITISARAVATSQQGGTGCLLALSETQASAITVGGSSVTTLINCEMVSNGPGNSIDHNGATNTVIAGCARATGSVNLNLTAVLTCGAAIENANPISDPLAGVPEPVSTGACQGDRVQNETLVPIEAHASGMMSMRFCNGLDVTGTVTFSPGLYLIEGGTFKINANALAIASGAVFYLADGVDIQFNGTATIMLSAPTSGTYQGVLFFGSRAATTVTHRFNGNAATTFDGAIYAPASHLQMNGGGNTSGLACTQIIGDTIEITGSAMLTLHCLFPMGPTIDIAGVTSLVE